MNRLRKLNVKQRQRREEIMAKIGKGFFLVNDDLHEDEYWLSKIRLVLLPWMALLNMMDIETGVVNFTLDDIALLANVPVDEVSQSLEALARPDINYKEGAPDGHQVEQIVPGDWNRGIRIMQWPKIREAYDKTLQEGAMVLEPPKTGPLIKVNKSKGDNIEIQLLGEWRQVGGSKTIDA